MANVAFKKGLVANLPATYAEGTFYVTTDERALYLDVDGSTRVRIGDFQEFATLAELQANTNPSTTALYYVSGSNVLAKWNGSAYVQINPDTDTGATSVVTTGTGNAVTAAEYDAATRTLTLTLGATYTTADDVDNAIDAAVGDLTLDGTTYETVKAYVDKKTDGIATDTALETLTSRVTTAEGEIDTLQSDVDTLEALVGTLPEGATATDVVGYVDEKVAAAVEEATYDDTALAARVTTNEGAIETLNGDSTVVGSVASQVAAAVAQIVADAPEAYDTLKEIADWISTHADSASAMNTAINQNASDIDALETLIGTLPEGASSTTIVAYINEVVSGSGAASASDLSAAVDRISALEDAIAALDVADEAVAGQFVTAVSETDGKISVTRAALAASDIPDLSATYDAAGAADTALASAKTYTDEAVEAAAMVWGSF